jgi:hypothetical protein
MTSFFLFFYLPLFDLINLVLAASYSELAFASFGLVGQYIVDFLYLLYLFGALVGYIEILGILIITKLFSKRSN